MDRTYRVEVYSAMKTTAESGGFMAKKRDTTVKGKKRPLKAFGYVRVSLRTSPGRCLPGSPGGKNKGLGSPPRPEAG